MILPNYAGSKALARLEKDLANAKDNGSYATTEFAVQELTEYNVQATNLNAAPVETSTASGSGDMPWD